jgi:hypothetical protein
VHEQQARLDLVPVRDAVHRHGGGALHPITPLESETTRLNRVDVCEHASQPVPDA